MSITLIVLIVLGAAIIIYLLVRGGSKEFKPKLSYKDRAELDHSIDDKDKPRTKSKTEKETESGETPLHTFPSKDYLEELLKSKTIPESNDEEFKLSFRKAISKAKENDFRNSLAEFSKALDIKKDDAITLYCRGLIKCKLDNYESAASDFTGAISADLEDVNALFYRGVARYHIKEYSSALQDFSGYVNAVPDYPMAFYYIGLVKSKTQNYHDAVRNFSLAVELNSRFAEAYFERAMAKEFLGDREGCCSDLKTAINNGHLDSYHYIKKYCSEGESST